MSFVSLWKVEMVSSYFHGIFLPVVWVLEGHLSAWVFTNTLLFA